MAIPGPSLAVSALELGGLAYLQTLQGGAVRTIGPFQAQVTPEERHEDDMEITEHPVEQSANISDHAYRRPRRLRIVAGWSNSPSPTNTGLLAVPANIIAALGSTPNAFGPGAHYVQQVYASLLALMWSATPVVIVTGKGTYVNMLLKSIIEETKPATEYALILTIDCQEVILVSTFVTSVPPAQRQQYPQKTAAPQSMGTQGLIPAPNFNFTAASAIPVPG